MAAPSILSHLGEASLFDARYGPAVMLRAFGLTLRSALQLPGAWTGHEVERRVDLDLIGAASEKVAGAFSGGRTDGWRGLQDGRPIVVSVGVAGDALVTLDGIPAFHLDAPVRRLQCHLPPGDVTAVRALLDSVLFTAALLSGREVLHCAAVLGNGGVIAVAADTGGGKSTLMTELVANGEGFFTDDILALRRDGGRAPIAYAGPPLLTRPGPPAQAVGEPITDLAHETWCALEVAADEAPLAAVVLLDRSQAGPGTLDRLAPSPIPVLKWFVGFPQCRERELDRFELASDIARRVPLYRLAAAAHASPSELAMALRPLLA